MITTTSISVRDMKLAMALVVMNVPPSHDPIQHVSDGKDYCLFWFQDDGRTQDFIKAWEAGTDGYCPSGASTHELQNDKHPFWFIRAALRNRERYLSGINKGAHLSFIKKFGKTFVEI